MFEKHCKQQGTQWWSMLGGWCLLLPCTTGPHLCSSPLPKFDLRIHPSHILEIYHLTGIHHSCRSGGTYPACTRASSLCMTWPQASLRS